VSNPHRREWPAWWNGAQERDFAARHWASLGASDHRIRHGARSACKRLRGERDAARTWRRITATTIRLACRILGDESGGLCELAGNVVAERDAARLELRALEWLLIHHPDELRALVMADGDKSGRYSYCARALGWEG
jgi:hypothetical protein